MTAPVDTTPRVRHEEFCLPREGEKDPRLESFKAQVDDAVTGRSVVTHTVTRCLECGAASYKQIGA